MEIQLLLNTSEKNKINKLVTHVTTLEGSLKEPSSIIDPVITIEYTNPTTFNYCYIPEFNRYYYVKDITIILNNIMKITLHVDVLNSFKNEIMQQAIIMDKNTSNFDNYLIDNNRIVNVKTKTDIMNFPNGLLESGQFILITAGG